MLSKKQQKEFISQVLEKIGQNKRVKESEGQFRLYIDRLLPYIIVYRIPQKKQENYASRLILGQASYLICPATDEYQKFIDELLQDVAALISKKYGSFLIIEIWVNKNPKAPFLILAPQDAGHSTVDSLLEELEKINKIHPGISSRIIETDARHPPGLPPVANIKKIKRSESLLLGIEVPEIYRDQVSGEVFPVFFRAFHKVFIYILQKAIFNFIRIQTDFNVTNYLMLGRSTIEPNVWHIDRELCAIEQSFPFLLLISPINTRQAYQEFKKHKFKKIPEFRYRLLPIDPEILKQQLFNLNIHNIIDPVISFLLREKREELDTKITMLGERNTKNFYYSSVRLYKGVEEKLLKMAEGLLATIIESDEENIEVKPSGNPGKSKLNLINARDFKKKAEEEYNYFRSLYPDFSSTVEIRDDMNTLMVSFGNLLIPNDLKIYSSRLEALIQHEVGTHVLTFVNGSEQPLQQLKFGLAGYEELQEGIAVLSEYLVGGLSKARMKTLAARVVSAHHLMEGADFIENFDLLRQYYPNSPKTAFDIVSRIYLAGGNIKDVIYLRGLVHLLEYLKTGGNFENLLIGKIAFSHIPLIEELQHREMLKKMPLLPRYLIKKTAKEKLKKLRDGILLTDLIEK